MALEKATGAERELLSGFYAGSVDVDPERITATIEDLGIRGAVRATLHDHLDRAFAALKHADLAQPFAGELQQLARHLVDAPP